MRRDAASLPTRRDRGAALITALLIAALAATMVAGMVWAEWSGISQEQAARQSAQARWILRGAVDWARLILQNNARNAQIDDLSQAWAVPLAESGLSTFLAAHGQGAAGLDDAWLTGGITDAQSRFNLANLAPGGSPDPNALATLQNLCAALGVSPQVAQSIAAGVAAAQAGTAPGTGVGQDQLAGAAALPLRELQDVAALGPAVAQALPRLAPYVTLLPMTTTVNANTAGAVVLAAVLGIPADDAARLVQMRAQTPFNINTDVAKDLGGAAPPQTALAQLGVNSGFFEAVARVRLGDFEYAETALIQRIGQISVVLRIQQVPPWLALPQAQ